MNAWKTDNLISFAAAVAAFAEGRDTPRAFLERAIEAIVAREPELKAFVSRDLEGARAAADASSERYRASAPLSAVDGCPFGVKDVIETADLPTQMNSPIYEGWRPRRDAACVRALKLGGAVLVGKTVTTEFACGRSGPTVNPHDPTRTPGGSSSGSGAAVGAGLLPVALGTQAGGSTIRPASYCGAFGFKPSVGALSMAGIHTVGVTHDHLGIIAASIEDVWRTARRIGDTHPGPDGLAGEGHELPRTRNPERLVRLHTAAWEELDADTKAAFEDHVCRLRGAGIEVVGRDDDTDIAALETALADGVGGRHDVVAYEMRWPFQEYVERHGESLSETVHAYMRRAAEITPTEHRRLLDERERMRERVTTLSRRFAGFVTLASLGPAPKGFEYTGDRTFLNTWSWLGFPSFSLPLLAVAGLPVGVQLMGFADADDRLAAHAAWIMETVG